MANLKLLTVITAEKLKEMGFIEENDGSDDPRGIDYNIRNDNFHLMIDPWGDVKLARLNPDSDYVSLMVDTIYDLQCVIDWISEC